MTRKLLLAGVLFAAASLAGCTMPDLVRSMTGGADSDQAQMTRQNGRNLNPFVETTR
ncbi:MAG TPA: hypothetical protein VHV08_12585 [Pirellulales bacterium]|nr:hypothetical protein [Pirellulales bacterium]